MAKTNSLQDPEICRALYRASQAGVKVLLNVRGICCLRPGVAGVSENIEVRSIVDRFLEHARVFYFRNGGHEEVYLSSADWMQRNLSKRLEMLFPVIDPGHRRRLIDVLETYFADNVKAWRLRSDGSYEQVGRKGPRVRAQQKFYKDAVDAVRDAAHAAPQFRPLTRPKPERARGDRLVAGFCGGFGATSSSCSFLAASSRSSRLLASCRRRAGRRRIERTGRSPCAGSFGLAAW